MTYGQLALICIAPVVLLVVACLIGLYRGRKGRRYD